MNDKYHIAVFDTNIFLSGIDFNIFKNSIYTTPNVIEEVKVHKYLVKNRNILNKIYAAIESKKLRIKSPDIKFLQDVNEKSKKTGDFSALSNIDKELIALTLELSVNYNHKVKLYTNDYSIENVCAVFNIPYISLYKNGIDKKIIWEVYCPNCKIIHKAEDFNKTCEICGLRLKRRPKSNIS
ncbi:MAG: NOB1 family endonuclease [Promethearchaeota archaeon]